VLSILEVVARHCQDLAIEDMRILGTAPTMNAPKCLETLRRFGNSGQAPAEDAERAEIVELIDELYADTNDEAARRIGATVKRNSRLASRMPTACLSCTELQLAFKAIEHATHFKTDGILYVNAAMVDAQAAFRELLL
jgi:aspartate/glutamate racemase